MKPIVRYAALAALLTGCHHDLIERDCAKTAEGCVDAAVDTNVAVDSEVVDSGSPPDTGEDSTIEDSGAGDTAMDATDDGVDVLPDTGNEVLPDTGGDACATMTCTTPPAETCASSTSQRTYAATGSCSGGICTYAPTDTPCAADEICSAGVCTPPSCAGGLSCGSVSCCDSKLVPGGTVPMGRAATGPENDVCSTWASSVCDPAEQPQHNATVSTFRLDTFEVTVGRFRKFVAAYPGSKPAAGAGVHPWIAGTGWQSSWNSNLPTSGVDLTTALKCEPTFQTWTDTPGSNENKPINCVDWYLAFAFCAWDGARLPTEAEWEYASAGGDDNRVLPWGNTAPNSSLAVYSSSPLTAVGSKSSGLSRWGQLDLAGSVAEWNLDWLGTYATGAVTNYARVSGGTYRSLRGGSFSDDAGRLRVASRGNAPPELRFQLAGVRCAR